MPDSRKEWGGAVALDSGLPAGQGTWIGEPMCHSSCVPQLLFLESGPATSAS